MQKNLKSFLTFIIKVSISIVLLIFLFSRIDLTKTLFYIRTLEPFYFMCAVLIFLGVVTLGIARWSVLLRALKRDLPLSRIFVSHCGGLFFNVFLPSTIGGDIARTVDLSFHTKDSSSIFATVFLDRACGLFAMSLIAFCASLFAYFFGITRDFRIFFVIAILVFLATFLFFLIFNKKFFNLFNRVIRFNLLRNYLAKFHNCCYSFRSQKKVLIKAILLSLVIQGGFSVAFYFIGLSLGIKLNIAHFLVLIPIINTVSFLPISFGGLGLRDNVAVVLFSSLGVASDKVAAMTLIIFAFLFFIGVAGGIIYGATLYSRRL